MRPNSLPSLGRYLTLSAALVALLLLSAKRLPADTVEMINGDVVSGVVRSLANGKVTLDVTRPSLTPVVEDKLFSAILKEGKSEKAKPLATKPAELRAIPLTDVVQIKLEPVFDRSNGSPPLIDNDPAWNRRPASGTIKLRGGYHKFVLAYWHRSGGAFLRLAYCRVEKPDEDRQRFVPGDMLMHLGKGGSETPSAGVDKEGYRLPERLSGEVVPQCNYSLRRRPDGRPFAKMADVLGATSSIGVGILDRISTRPLPNEDQDVAMLLAGYLHIPKDGSYKFSLSSDGGSQLFVGQTPGGLRSMDASLPPAPWILSLTSGGSVRGTIESWTDSKINLNVAAGRSRVAVSIPSARVTEIWSNKDDETAKSEKKEDAIDRSNLPVEQNVVFAHSAAGAAQRVPCHVLGIQGESLAIEFNGSKRKIALSKVVGMILAPEHGTPDSEQTFHQTVETFGGIKFPGQLTTMDASVAKVRTLWGEMLTLKTEDLKSISIKNGKAISLTDFEPSQVTQVPFFERLIPYRVNESLSGGPILLRDGKHSNGISVHSRTELRYAIGGRFRRFRAKLGFQLPEGELGDVSIRVLGDDKALFERTSFRGDGPIESIDLDVIGVSTLTLAVDFGRREDVGDRVVWADPTLIRAETGPLSTAPQQDPAK